MVNDLYHKKFPPLAYSLSRTKFFLLFGSLACYKGEEELWM